MTKYPHRLWRFVGRSIYVQLGHEPSDKDPLIGVMVGDDAKAIELAERCVRDHNLTVVKK